MKMYSETTHLEYEAEDAIYYRNMIQSAFMLGKSDCVLLDVFENNGQVVMCFPKWMHKKYIREWAERTQKTNKEEVI